MVLFLLLPIRLLQKGVICTCIKNIVLGIVLLFQVIQVEVLQITSKSRRETFIQPTVRTDMFGISVLPLCTPRLHKNWIL